MKAHTHTCRHIFSAERQLVPHTTCRRFLESSVFRMGRRGCLWFRFPSLGHRSPSSLNTHAACVQSKYAIAYARRRLRNEGRPPIAKRSRLPASPARRPQFDMALWESKHDARRGVEVVEPRVVCVLFLSRALISVGADIPCLSFAVTASLSPGHALTKAKTPPAAGEN